VRILYPGRVTDRISMIDATGAPLLAVDPAALARGEALHRELRPDIPDNYVAYLEHMLDEGARIVQLVDAGEPRAIAVWRLFHTTYCGRRLEVEDLVTAACHRSSGYGATILGWLEARARDAGCPTIYELLRAHGGARYGSAEK